MAPQVFQIRTVVRRHSELQSGEPRLVTVGKNNKIGVTAKLCRVQFGTLVSECRPFDHEKPPPSRETSRKVCDVTAADNRGTKRGQTVDLRDDHLRQWCYGLVLPKMRISW